MLQVYSSSSEKRKIGFVFKSMFSSVIPSFFAGYSLHRKQLAGEKSRSRLSVLWSLIEPLLLGLIFVGLYQYRAIAPLESGLPYALFVISGVMIWQSLMDGFNVPLGMISRSKELLLNTKVRPEALMWSVIARVFYNGSFRLFVVAGFLLYFGLFDPINVAKACGYFYSVVFFMCALGLLLEPFNAVLEDISRVVNLVLRPLMFISGVIFPVRDIEALSLFNDFNFLFLIVENFRSILIDGAIYRPTDFWVVASALVIVFFIAWYVFHLSVRLVAEKG